MSSKVKNKLGAVQETLLVWFKWRCDDPKSLEALGMKLMKSTTFFDADPAIKERLPLKFRLVFRFCPWLLKRKAGGYKMSLFQFEAA